MHFAICCCLQLILLNSNMVIIWMFDIQSYSKLTCVIVIFCPPAKMVRVSGTRVACWIPSVVCWVCTYCGWASEIDVGKCEADVNCTTCWPSTVESCCGSTFICKYVPGKTRLFASIWAIICWSLLLPSFTVIGKKHLLPDDKIFKSCNVMACVLFEFATVIVLAGCSWVTIEHKKWIKNVIILIARSPFYHATYRCWFESFAAVALAN